MLEKLALLKIALCKAPAFSGASECRTSDCWGMCLGVGFVSFRVR
jgi:hypothetical protein